MLSCNNQIWQRFLWTTCIWTFWCHQNSQWDGRNQGLWHGTLGNHGCQWYHVTDQSTGLLCANGWNAPPVPTRLHTTRLKLSTLIPAMSISCNWKLLPQIIFLESVQAPWQFMLTSAWVHVSLFLQDLDTFLLQSRNNLNPAIQLQDCNVLQSLQPFHHDQPVSLKISMMSATRIFLRLNKVSNLITTAWGTLVSNPSSTYAPKNVNFLSLMVFHLPPNCAFWQKTQSRSLAQHLFVQPALLLACANVLMVPDTPS